MAEELIDGPGDNPFLKSLKEFKQNKSSGASATVNSSTTALSPFGDIEDPAKKKSLLQRLIANLPVWLQVLFPQDRTL